MKKTATSKKKNLLVVGVWQEIKSCFVAVTQMRWVSERAAVWSRPKQKFNLHYRCSPLTFCCAVVYYVPQIKLPGLISFPLLYCSPLNSLCLGSSFCCAVCYGNFAAEFYMSRPNAVTLVVYNAFMPVTGEEIFAWSVATAIAWRHPLASHVHCH